MTTTPRCRRGHIDVVDADAGAADHLQIGAAADLGGHLVAERTARPS
jgi:hypothetical protein